MLLALARIRAAIWRIIETLTLAGSLAGAFALPAARSYLIPIAVIACATAASDLLRTRTA